MNKKNHSSRESVTTLTRAELCSIKGGLVYTNIAFGDLKFNTHERRIDGQELKRDNKTSLSSKSASFNAFYPGEEGGNSSK